MTPLEKRVSEDVSKLSQAIKGLRVEVEAWRTHTGSTGYFLQVAVEDLIRVVDELKTALHGRDHEQP
jgi:hypothetical protein